MKSLHRVYGPLAVCLFMASAAVVLALPAFPSAASAVGRHGSDVDHEDFIRQQCADEPGREDLDLVMSLPDGLPVDVAVLRAFSAEYGSGAGFLHYRRRDGRRDDEQHYVVPLGSVEISRRRVTLLFDCGREADCILASGAPGGRTRRLGIACHSPHLVFEMLDVWMNREGRRLSP